MIYLVNYVDTANFTYCLKLLFFRKKKPHCLCAIVTKHGTHYRMENTNTFYNCTLDVGGIGGILEGNV